MISRHLETGGLVSLFHGDGDQVCANGDAGTRGQGRVVYDELLKVGTCGPVATID